ncbi:hypothetical protein BN14_04980 [Rhizoctonia solani AG-1 IB]|uniref:Uncharacterized protein n=1 Tax=Thanatephorus cucumeris (strain AG1-IB / isolate 7/3/14) TaxID=1108050 RepID=M5BUN8_THACB|nr:hypothetical protein BN14_04980 [Rhizoctonia solani AG-1 IB]
MEPPERSPKKQGYQPSTPKPGTAAVILDLLSSPASAHEPNARPQAGSSTFRSVLSKKPGVAPQVKIHRNREAPSTDVDYLDEATMRKFWKSAIDRYAHEYATKALRKEK